MHIGHRPQPLGQRATEAAGELRQQIRELETELATATRKLADARSRSETIERRAMDAVRAGDDRVARDALVELQPHVEEAALIEADIKVLRALLSECDDFLRHSSGSTEPPSPKVIANNQLHLRREDLAALTAAYLRESRAPRQWALAGAGVGGLALGASLIALGGLLGWSQRLDPYFFFGGWAFLLACGARLWHRENAARRRYQFQCPACEAKLLDGLRDRAGLARVELVIATGNCPRCGANILAP